MRDIVVKLPKYKIVAFCGEAGSGKDFLLHRFIENNPSYHEIIRTTTRPKREKEVDGLNYYFITPELFAEKLLNDEFIEATVFNNWCYGTSYDSLRVTNINIGVFDPDAIRAILSHPNVDLLIFYVKTSTDKIRLLRQLNREIDPDVNEIMRRYQSDKLDFASFEDEFLDQCIILKNDTTEDYKQALVLIKQKISEFGVKEN